MILREAEQSHSSKGTNALTTAHNVDPPACAGRTTHRIQPRRAARAAGHFIHTLMGVEADAPCGAAHGRRSGECTRNGYRHRQFDTRAGSLDLAIPKLRHQRKRDEGKRPISATICLARHRTNVLYALIRDNRTWQPDSPPLTKSAA